MHVYINALVQFIYAARDDRPVRWKNKVLKTTVRYVIGRICLNDLIAAAAARESVSLSLSLSLSRPFPCAHSSRTIVLIGCGRAVLCALRFVSVCISNE